MLMNCQIAVDHSSNEKEVMIINSVLHVDYVLPHVERMSPEPREDRTRQTSDLIVMTLVALLMPIICRVTFSAVQ